MSEKQSPKKQSAFMRPVSFSADLGAVLGTNTPMPRTEVMKKLWDYIKKHKLQDPQNKRNIIPDQKLAKVFGSTQPINMFKMTSKVSTHLHDTAMAGSRH